MRSAGQTIGVMAVATRDEARRIEFDDVETLQSLADFVGVALEQRRTAEAVAQSMREARSLADASRALLTRTANRDVLLTQILDALATHFGREACSLLLVERDAERPRPVRSPREVVVDGRPGVRRSRSRPRASSRSPARTGARRERARRLARTGLRRRLAGCALGARRPSCPRRDGDRRLRPAGGRGGAFSDADVRNISAFAERAALALRLAELVGAYEQRTRVLEAVARATQLLNFRLHAPDVLTSVVEETTRAFPAADGAVAWVADAPGRTPLRRGRFRRRGHDAPRRRDRAPARRRALGAPGGRSARTVRSSRT